MGGRIIHVPEHPAPCSGYFPNCDGMPRADDHRPGTIWECDLCRRKWVVVAGAQYNEAYQAWRELTEKNREGRDEF